MVSFGDCLCCYRRAVAPFPPSFSARRVLHPLTATFDMHSFSRTLFEVSTAWSLNGSAGTAITPTLPSVMLGLAGRQAGEHTAFTLLVVSTGGSAVSVMAGLSTGSLSGTSVTFQESVSRQYVDGSLKAIQEAFRQELR